MASKRRIRRKACEGKIRHRERGHACAALKSLQKSAQRTTAIGLIPYLCQFCHGWHLGHRRGSRTLAA